LNGVAQIDQHLAKTMKPWRVSLHGCSKESGGPRSFEDTVFFEFPDDAVVDKILGLQPAELGIDAFKNTQSIAHSVDGRKNAPAIEQTHRTSRSTVFPQKPN
jgi:hypothetical protein